jgi:predicted acylesterase/phospholipase RssA
MSYVVFFYQWILKRLPKPFSIPLVIFLILYFAFAFPLVVLRAGPYAEAYVAKRVPNYSIPFRTALGIPADYSVVGGIVSALLIIAVALAGVLLSWALAAVIYRLIRGKPMRGLKLYEPAQIPAAPAGPPDSNNPLAKYERIGIILAGGGAKGAYQAGAMQAIYEFLEKNHALHKVRMVAGTSIGSWNSLFWLAGMVKRGDDNTSSILEQWWHKVDVKSVIRPAVYIPLRQNYLLSADPWQETFARLFKENAGARDLLLHHINHKPPTGDHNDCQDAIHFYLTRSNVATGKLEFTTNRDDLSNVEQNLPKGLRPRQKATPDLWKAAVSVDDLQHAVFASMDIPPLFKNVEIGDDIFEDGGVVDNLPIKFGTEFENCDLLFILPLNASFAQKPDQRSIVKRLFRVLDVRQGVLERNSFKMVYLYNELAALRDQAAGYLDASERYEAALRELRRELASSGESVDIDSLAMKIDNALAATEGGNPPSVIPAIVAAPETATAEGSAIKRALTRKHKMVQVFSICPAPELLINTAEFWKTSESGHAFRLMYKTTRNELKQFFDRDQPAPDWIRMAKVSPEGDVDYLMDF